MICERYALHWQTGSNATQILCISIYALVLLVIGVLESICPSTFRPSDSALLSVM